MEEGVHILILQVNGILYVYTFMKPLPRLPEPWKAPL